MTRTERIVVLAMGAALLALFTFLDLPISLTLHTQNAFGRILEIVGELPFAFLAVFALALLLRFRSDRIRLASAALGMLYALLLAAFALLGGFMAWNYLHENVEGAPQFLAIAFAAALAVGAVLLARRVPRENARRAVTFAILAIAYFVAVIVVMNAVKAVWGRMRIRDMTDPLSQFTRWYRITPRGGFDNVYASFPSGHAMNAAGTMLLCLLPSLLPGLRGKEATMKGIAYAWIVLVGTSRVVMGAHFATDVVAGALLSLALFEALRWVVCRARGVRLIET